MKLIHTADLHLGARTETKLSPRRAEERRAELLATFADIAALAEREGAAVLVAGDLFDTAAPSRRTLAGFLDTVRDHPTVRFLCLPGNHDGGQFPEVALPENLFLFGKEWARVTLGDTDIYGIAPEGDIPYDALTPDPARRNVVLLHGAVREGGTPEPGAVVLSRLAGRGIDYLALGHYHSHRVGKLDSRGVFAYSGTPEGRGMDETGECGVLLIDTALSPVAPVFLPTARRCIHAIPVDASAGDLRTDLFRHIVRKGVRGGIVPLYTGREIVLCLIAERTVGDLRLEHRRKATKFLYVSLLNDKAEIVLLTLMIGRVKVKGVTNADLLRKLLYRVRLGVERGKRGIVVSVVIVRLSALALIARQISVVINEGNGKHLEARNRILGKPL